MVKAESEPDARWIDRRGENGFERDQNSSD